MRITSYFLIEFENSQLLEIEFEKEFKITVYLFFFQHFFKNLTGEKCHETRMLTIYKTLTGGAATFLYFCMFLMRHPLNT